MKTHLLTLAFIVATPLTALAAPVTFFGQDAGLGEKQRLPGTPNADAARDAFFAAMDDPDWLFTEDFEGKSLSQSFFDDGDSLATFQANGRFNRVRTLATGADAGRYPTSGNNFLETASGLFELSFANPTNAFGFYGIDFGDFSGLSSLTITYTDGSQYIHSFANVTDPLGGDVLYWGIIDSDKEFKSVSFSNSKPATDNNGKPQGGDWFAFDDISFGYVGTQQIPEPGALTLLALGLGVFGFQRRQRR